MSVRSAIALTGFSLLGVSMPAGNARAGVVADFIFSGSGGAGTTVTSNGYTATLAGNAMLAADGVHLPGDNTSYVTTNLPLSALGGSSNNTNDSSFTIEVLAESTATNGYRQLVGGDNDFDFYLGNNNGNGQLTYLVATACRH